MGGVEGGRTVQALDRCTEDRRAMRIHGQCIDTGAQGSGQHGSSADVAQTSRQLYAYERDDAIHIHADDRVQRGWAG
eukprot:12945834-Heterocapsa_arctica.AAC.1